MPKGKRKKSDKPMRVYAFKVKAILEGGEIVCDQLHRAHEYKKRLVAIERERRTKVEALIRELVPDLIPVERSLESIRGEIGRIRDAIKARSPGLRKRAQPTPEEKARLAALAPERKRLVEARRALRAALFAKEDAKARLKEIDTAAKDLIRGKHGARAENGLYWGTYLFVEQSLKSIRKGAPPDFPRWSLDGAVVVQLQKGLAWSRALAATDTRIRVEERSEIPRPTHSKAGKFLPPPDPNSRRSRERRLARVWLRVGTAENRRSPVWAKLLVHLHRQPPPEARIKWVRLHRRYVGRSTEWEIQFVMEADAWPKECAKSGSATVRVGWTSVPDGLRVATARGSNGAEHTLVLPRDWVDAWEHLDSLEAIRRRRFNAIREELVTWLDRRKVALLPEDGEVSDAEEPAPGALPDWMLGKEHKKDDLRHLRRWKSIDRLYRIVGLWRHRRFPGDHKIFPVLEAWRKKDRHLHDWQDKERRKLRRRREESYRRFASKLARTYRTLRLPDTDWAKVKANPPAERDEVLVAVAKFHGQIASPGRLVACLKERAAVVELYPAKETGAGPASGAVVDGNRGTARKSQPGKRAVVAAVSGGR